MGIQEREERKEIFETTMHKISSKLTSDTKLHIQEIQRIPSRINTKKTLIPRYNIFKVQKIKDREKNRVRRQREKIPHLYRNKELYLISPQKLCKEE